MSTILSDLISRAIASVVHKCGRKEGHEPLAVAEVLKDAARINPNKCRAIVVLAVEEDTCVHGNPTGVTLVSGMAGDTRILEALMVTGDTLIEHAMLEQRMKQSGDPLTRALFEMLNTGARTTGSSGHHTNQTFAERYGPGACGGGGTKQ